MNQKVGGFKNCTYIYVNLKYYESLKSCTNFGSVEHFYMRNGNLKDFLLFLMSIIYIGSGSSHRKLSHCALTQALNHNRNKHPQKVHRKILETWLRGSCVEDKVDEEIAKTNKCEEADETKQNAKYTMTTHTCVKNKIPY